MEKSAGKLLRSDNVKFEGRLQLGIMQTEPQSHVKNTAQSKPTVRICEKGPQCVILEVICSCGIKTYVRCDYDASSQTHGTKLESK